MRATTVTLIVDGMDQAKFMWPRAEFMKSHQFDKYIRPRLHVTGLIAHGHFVMFAVSDADVRKSSNSTCEMLAIALQRLADSGVTLAGCHVNLQLDNAGSQNKNNTVMSYVATLVGSGIISSGAVQFLRTGHTHEDIDRIFSLLSKWMKKYKRVETVSTFVECIGAWLQSLNRPYEALRFCIKLDQIRDFKVWLSFVGRTLSGHGGPAAPHSFVFTLRRGATRVEHL